MRRQQQGNAHHGARPQGGTIGVAGSDCKKPVVDAGQAPGSEAHHKPDQRRGHRHAERAERSSPPRMERENRLASK